MRAPSGRKFAAGALASFVAVFGVLALRVREGDDPGLASTKATNNTTTTTTTGATSSDDSSGTSEQQSAPAVTPTPGATTSAS
ncbi:MAG TPA: hypothetical protein VI318_12315 [Baekduia sp.]